MNDLDPMTTQRACLTHLEALVSNNAGIQGALLSTIDGFEVAAHMSGTPSPKKLAAMTSSLLALSEAVTLESGLGQCQDLVIEARSGRILLMEVPSASHKSVLTVLCTESATLGSVLWAAKNSREQIAQSLDALAVERVA